MIDGPRVESSDPTFKQVERKRIKASRLFRQQSSSQWTLFLMKLYTSRNNSSRDREEEREKERKERERENQLPSLTVLQLHRVELR